MNQSPPAGARPSPFGAPELSPGPCGSGHFLGAVPFDDSARCHGCKSGITGALQAICITCSRLTYRRDVPLLQGKVYRDRGGSADCECWKPHVANVPMGWNGAKSAERGGEGLSISNKQEVR